MFPSRIPNGRNAFEEAISGCGDKSTKLCTMCIKKANAISHCKTCNRNLCITCDSGHKMMVCFKTHEVTSFDSSNTYVCGLNESQFSPISFLTDGQFDENKLKDLFFNGKDSLNEMLKHADQLKTYRDDLGKCRLECMSLVNELNEKYQRLFKQYRDEVVLTIEEMYNTKYESLYQSATELDGFIKYFASQLSYLRRLIGDSESSVYRPIGVIPKTNGVMNGKTSATASTSSYQTTDTWSSNSTTSFASDQPLTDEPQYPLRFDIDKLLSDNDEPEGAYGITKGTRGLFTAQKI